MNTSRPTLRRGGNVSEMSKAETELRAAGFDVSSHISRGIGHGIAPDGLTLGLQFLMQHLGYDR